MDNLKDLILGHFKENPDRIFKSNTLSKELSLSIEMRKSIKKTLRMLADSGDITELRNSHYTLLKKSNDIIGRISVAQQGFGFVKSRNFENGEVEIFIRTRNMKDAMDGDTVEVTISKNPEKTGKSFEGKVLRIVERGKKFVVGKFYLTKNGAVVQPRNKSFGRKIFINKTFKKGEIKNEIWVVVEIVKYLPSPEPLIGKIVEILGEDGDKGLDVMVLIKDYGVTPEFPKNVLEEADNIEAEISESEISERLDLRKKKIFTIDPVHAKDFDDAISVEVINNDTYRVGVHIADVAHYVRKGTLLDDEALERATSIYPVDRVVPMLPERISNNLCSLVPHKDRLTMSVIIDMDKQANVIKAEFYNSIINSIHRLNYYEVQKIFEDDPTLSEKYKDIVQDIQILKHITQRLRALRFKRGALDLDIPETEVVMDEKGVAVDIRPYERLESHKLVEECMLIANELVASHLQKKKIPTIYRIHEIADPKKLEGLAPALKIFGLKLPPKEMISTKTLQQALEQTQKKENGSIARRMILRSLKRAKYLHINRGHFGLASEAYLHFTSPIRRYPDLVVHRILKEWIANNNMPQKRKDELDAELPDLAFTSSEREDRATLIERDTTELKCFEFMRKFIGDEFTGFISGMNSYSFYVSLTEYPVEGVVLLKDIKTDYYMLDDTGYILKGKKSGRVLKLGQKVSVQITKIDLLNVEMDLQLIEQ